MANTTLNLATLDFDTIKTNLKTHLRNQAIFRDYDFEGSNMSVLLDILAQNTALNAFYMNMLASESFLDSAQLRSSVISHAKELNYRPRSARSAKATINLFVEQNNSNALVIPKGTTFTATYNSQTFSFATSEIKAFYTSLDESTDTYKFNVGPIDIYEGFYVTETFVVDYGNESQKFTISNPMVDTTSLVVNSIEDGGSNIESYTLSDTLLGVTNQSKVYFLQATEDEKYEVLFGDDIIGRRPKDGAVIQIQYRIATGAVPNGASVFTCDSDLTTDNSGRMTVTTVTVAIGGAEPESIASIKYNAPRHFQTQQRAITEEDYEDLMREQFPEIDAITVYGGETVTPPSYGKVFISLSISDVDGLPESKKIEYANFIKPKMAGPIQPVFVEPTFVYCRVDTNVKYNPNVTTLKPDEIRLLVSAAIDDFNDDFLDDFRVTLYESKFTHAIDEAHTSILGNNTKLYVYKKLTPTLRKFQNIDIDLGLPLRDDIPEIDSNHDANELKAVFSSPFVYNGENCIIEDDGVGGLRIMRASNNYFAKVKDIGTVDYDTGQLQLQSFYIDEYDGESLRIYAMPATEDITCGKNDILSIELDEVNIDVELVRE